MQENKKHVYVRRNVKCRSNGAIGDESIVEPESEAEAEPASKPTTALDLENQFECAKGRDLELSSRKWRL